MYPVLQRESGRGGGRGCSRKIAPATAIDNNNNNNDDDEVAEDQEEVKEVEIVDEPVNVQPRRSLPGGRSRGSKASDPANHTATRDNTDVQESTSVTSSTNSGGQGQTSKRNSDTTFDGPQRSSKRSRPSPQQDVFDSNIDNTSTSSGSKKRSSPGDDSDPDNHPSSKHKRLRANENAQSSKTVENDETSYDVMSTEPPSAARSRLNRRQSLFGLDSPRIQGSRRPIPIIITGTPAPPPRNGRPTAPANLMLSPTPARIYEARDDGPSGLFESDEEPERQAAMSSPLKSVEHRKTNSGYG
ncbi:hypothetical protein CERSUDRAFT_101142 [Gelatoporia subvermispora B]|uniref:Uncharacterized protein n=1 Tax=Ceriporiopsis subvermispora (strain B) TaxID=914234 RepID=M2P5W3_CERS8|nr:hypothetical protein CERSUDRAFT_101142 [Gelatoporia subvermispora B]